MRNPQKRWKTKSYAKHFRTARLYLRSGARQQKRSPDLCKGGFIANLLAAAAAQQTRGGAESQLVLSAAIISSAARWISWRLPIFFFFPPAEGWGRVRFVVFLVAADVKHALKSTLWKSEDPDSAERTWLIVWHVEVWAAVSDGKSYRALPESLHLSFHPAAADQLQARNIRVEAFKRPTGRLHSLPVSLFSHLHCWTVNACKRSVIMTWMVLIRWVLETTSALSSCN